MACSRRRFGRIDDGGISSQQRIHFAAVLIAILIASPLAAGDISFDPAITSEEFHLFSEIVGQAIFATPVEPAQADGILGFEVGVAAVAVPIDETARYWVRSVDSDLLTSGYLAVPKIVASKGIWIGNLSASYAEVPDSDLKVIGGAFDIPILRGGIARPTIAVRASYTDLQGVDELDMNIIGGEIFISKGIGPLTPYAGVGIARIESRGRIDLGSGIDPLVLVDDFEQQRVTLGVRVSLLIPKLVIEVTEAEERTYAAKVSLGF